MKAGKTPSLVGLLTDPSRLGALGRSDWDRVIRHARAAGLLGRLEVAASGAGLLETLPPDIRNHLESARVLAGRQAEAARWEVERIHSLLYPRGIPVMVLKGAAYAMTGSPVGRGRTFSDIDLLVPEKALPDVERALVADGWVRKQVTPHDRRYYEEWMHEIPPMRHGRRKTNLDLHRAITPPIGKCPVDSRWLWDSAVGVPGWNDLYTLCPEDQFLHAAAHLFLEAEFEMACRDMIDMRLMYLGSSEPRDFAARLRERAGVLGLERPLGLAERALAAAFDVPVPELSRRGLVDALFAPVLQPTHPDFETPWRDVAAFLLYLRGHYLKMPLRLLIPHLFYKGFLAERAEQREREEREKNLARLRRMLGKP